MKSQPDWTLSRVLFRSFLLTSALAIALFHLVQLPFASLPRLVLLTLATAAVDLWILRGSAQATPTPGTVPLCPPSFASKLFETLQQRLPAYSGFAMLGWLLAELWRILPFGASLFATFFVVTFAGYYLRAWNLERLFKAALLHDMVKLIIPEYVVTTPGRLTEDEFALVKEHPEASVRLASRIAPEASQDRAVLGAYRDVFETIWRLLLAASEACTNAIDHAGGGELGLVENGLGLAAVVRDRGPGIDLNHLPQAVFTKRSSLPGSLGHGFEVMLRSVEKVYLSTSPQGTTVVLCVHPWQPAPAARPLAKSEVAVAGGLRP